MSISYDPVNVQQHKMSEKRYSESLHNYAVCSMMLTYPKYSKSTLVDPPTTSRCKQCP